MISSSSLPLACCIFLALALTQCLHHDLNGMCVASCASLSSLDILLGALITLGSLPSSPSPSSSSPSCRESLLSTLLSPLASPRLKLSSLFCPSRLDELPPLSLLITNSFSSPALFINSVLTLSGLMSNGYLTTPRL